MKMKHERAKDDFRETIQFFLRLSTTLPYVEEYELFVSHHLHKSLKRAAEEPRDDQAPGRKQESHASNPHHFHHPKKGKQKDRDCIIVICCTGNTSKNAVKCTRPTPLYDTRGNTSIFNNAKKGLYKKYSPAPLRPGGTARWSSGTALKMLNLGFRSSLTFMMEATLPQR